MDWFANTDPPVYATQETMIPVQESLSWFVWHPHLYDNVPNRYQQRRRIAIYRTADPPNCSALGHHQA